MTDVPRPTVGISAGYQVEFYTPYDDFPRLPECDDTISRFLEWGIANRVFPMRGTGASSPGRHVGVYEAADVGKILEWVRNENLVVDTAALSPTDAAGLLVVGTARLVDAVEQLVRNGTIDARSRAGDTLLDLRDNLNDLREAGVAPHAFATYDAWKAEHP